VSTRHCTSDTYY